MPDVDKADGICRHCGGEVPVTNTNQFFCSEPCRREGYLAHYGELKKRREAEKRKRDAQQK